MVAFHRYFAVLLLHGQVMHSSAFAVPSARMATQKSHVFGRTGLVLYAEESSSSSSSEESSPQPAAASNNDSSPSQSSRSAVSRTNRKLDPLMVSLTRNNDPTFDPNAPTVSVPLIGDLALDRSFFLFVPIALFAVLGVLTSVYVLINSGDAFVDAIADSTAEIFTIPASSSSPAIDPGTCRGLCSSQEESLEGMRAFMNAISGK